MIPVLSGDQMRAFDAHAIRVAHVPGVLLMENAGRGATDILERELLGGSAKHKRIALLCGTGNNGGDGFVMARHLRARCANVEVFLVGDVSKITGDARVQHDAWRGIGGDVHPLATDAQLAPLRAALDAADVSVDALFGTGLDRAITGFPASVIDVLNASKATRLAVDLPSGVHADTGATLGVAVKAACTVTFAHRKLGLVTPAGADLAGRVFVANIGVPGTLPEDLRAAAQLMEPHDVAAWLGARGHASHKGSAGHVVVFAGSPGKVGAALLAARAVLRGGAGVVTIASRAEAIEALKLHAVEIMTTTIDPSRARVNETVDAALEGKRAVVVGPGFGLDEAAKAFVHRILDTWKGPAVVDADALTQFKGRPEAFAAAKGRLVLTPHPGEAGRLLSASAAEVEADRFTAARALAASTRAVVVLKGAFTIIAEPEGRVVVNGSGTSALATAGSGDVLGGLIAAQCCALDPFEAACAGVHLHGLAAEVWGRRHGDRGLLASEIADHVPEAIAELLRKLPRTEE